MAEQGKAEYVVGVDFGGTKILAGVYDTSLECYGNAKISTKAQRGAESVIERIARCVQDAVTRIMKDGGDVFVPDERISVEAALRAVTIDAAWQCRMDDMAGSLEPGKYADLAILERDPTAVSPIEIEKIKVNETWLAGERRFGG